MRTMTYLALSIRTVSLADLAHGHQPIGSPASQHARPTDCIDRVASTPQLAVICTYAWKKPGWLFYAARSVGVTNHF